MENATITTLRKKLERWELKHLRQHAADLADRLERAQEAANDEQRVAEFWRENVFSLQEELLSEGFTVGLTKEGQMLAAKPAELSFARPDLAEGEIYVGIIGNAEGQAHHIILLPGDNDGADWQSQMDWAKSIGGDLPTRTEQAMLYANFKTEFKDTSYWSSEQHSSEPARAWHQFFYNGVQCNDRKLLELRARAVRRLPI